MSKLLGVTTPVPESILSKEKILRDIRNAYEHIEDRALGQVNNTPDIRALTIFDWSTLLDEQAITYAEHRLELRDVPGLLLDTRGFLKQAASEATDPCPQD